jgi:hypothetical protein
MRLKSLFGLACGLAITTTVSAQTRPPTTAPGSVKPQVGAAQPAQTNPYPPALYRMNDVSKSMNLTQDQVANLNKLTDQTQAQYRDNYNKLSTLNDADRAARAQELNRQYYGDWNKGASSIFNDSQMSRYQQLNYQYGGFNTLYDPSVQKQLNLSPDQIRNLNEHTNWSNQQLQEINGIGNTDPTKGTQMYQDYWKQHQERFGKYLNSEQQRTWQQMTGEPYGFQPNFTPRR